MLGQSFSFAGAIADEHTGLLKMGRRDYDPQLGRWLSKEPLRFGAGIESFYLYAHGDPINFLDVNGNLSFPAVAAIAIVSTVVVVGGGTYLYKYYFENEYSIHDNLETLDRDPLKVFLGSEQESLQEDSSFARNVKHHPDECLQIIGHGTKNGEIIKYKTNKEINEPFYAHHLDFLVRNRIYFDRIIDNKENKCIQLIICGHGGIDKIAGSLLEYEGIEYVTYPTARVWFLEDGTYGVPFGDWVKKIK